MQKIKSKRVGYLGPAGSFTHQAALRFSPQDNLVPFIGISEVIDAVTRGRVSAGVVAVENILGGVVRETIDGLYRSNTKVTAERLLPIHHCLAVAKGHLEVREISGHAQAFAQCRTFLKKKFPNALWREYASNSLGMEEIATNQDAYRGAIGPESAARVFGLKIRYRNIEDHPGNVTRFWKLERKLQATAGHDTAGFAFQLGDRPGSLYAALGCFERDGIQVKRLWTLPSGEQMGRYTFYVEVNAQIESARAKTSLAGLKRIADGVKILGSWKGTR